MVIGCLQSEIVTALELFLVVLLTLLILVLRCSVHYFCLCSFGEPVVNPAHELDLTLHSDLTCALAFGEGQYQML